ncbi:MAG: tetratricopeptide repeat protein [Bryobacterales bacterium]|nr:tetratricopeptide repeat protein [Bryobacterales bacterium]
MSPEQAGSVGEDAGTRADVYSLGVILYEMLVGAPPHEYRNLSLEEMLRKLREEDARAPSSRVRTMGGQSTAAARHRRTEPRRLTRQLRGDLDSIALKALEKERGRRYGSPSELAADLERYLRNEPIAARSAGVLYQARKFFARHRAGVAAGLALAALLAAFAVTQAAQLKRITRERDRADLITNFMISMFRVSDPSEARGRSVTARELLDQASTGIDTGLTNDPLLRARMMQIMGTVYANLGIYTQAESLFQRAEGIRSSTLGRENPETLRSANSLVDAVFRQGRYAEADKMARASLDVERRVLGPEHPEILSLLDSLAGILDKEGREREAERMLRDTLAVERRVLGPANPATLRSLEHLAPFLKGAEAEKLSREVFETRRRILGPNHPETLASMNNLAIVLADRDEAEKLMLEAIQIERRVLGPDHPKTRNSIRNAVILLMGNGPGGGKFAE